MMDDVLISQLPPAILRSSLRALVSQGSAMQRVFVEHVRRRLTESPPQLPSASDLFLGKSPSYAEFLASTRCMFSSKMAQESLPYLTHLLVSIPESAVKWEPSDSLEVALERACGDIVQAVQALKESRPKPTEELQARLQGLQKALKDCETYCREQDLSYPFIRARLQVDDVYSLTFPENPQGRYSPLPSKFVVQPDPDVTQKLEYVYLGNIKVPRLFNGLWQMSSPAWGSASSFKQELALTQLVKKGLIATDMADHYGDAELVYGGFRQCLLPEVAESLVAATKWCVFRPIEVPITHEFVLAAVQERARRLSGRVELLQFHWYDYTAKDYLRILVELVNITKSHPHLVSTIGLCNFDAEHTEEACQYLLKETGEVGIVSNQIQYSLIDTRPMVKMSAVCQKYGIKLLTYGSFCGGFLSDKWLGRNAPDIYSESEQLTPSQRKYFDMILNWGTWTEFQGLLLTLKCIADKHQVELSNVAIRWILDRPEVGSVIVGTRLGVSNNSDSNLSVFSFRLDDADNRQLENIALGSRTKILFEKLGDCGHEYR
ncbi:aldo/keto reductase [Dendrothele bispora CBS 962.96]|uniref:Aldo/keto reductase n=1 Tax=Dendrothele bispora (strain CBS 962.96) TaxID=1314807 RepID=A0A4S8MUV7_DENBC|nr:aldo/keto reductase [Dendrothele bispora CBS 962.96]